MTDKAVTDKTVTDNENAGMGWQNTENFRADRTIETDSPRETYELGRRMGEKASAGQIYCLNGDLGVGKTVFAQGFAAGLGIAEPVNSPTFTIVGQYEGGRLTLYHFDVYRIEDAEEMYDIGFDEYFYGEGVCLIEWAERIREILPEEAISITIEKVPDMGYDHRRIHVEP